MTRHSVNSTTGRSGQGAPQVASEVVSQVAASVPGQASVPVAPTPPVADKPSMYTADPLQAPQFSFVAPSASVSEELNAAYTLQNLHNSGISMPPTKTIESDADVDFLTCGNCQKEFLLSRIVDFMKHKKLDCRDNTYSGLSPDLYRRLMCQIKNCQQKFATAWGLLQHVQNSHALNIFLNAYQAAPAPPAQAHASFDTLFNFAESDLQLKDDMRSLREMTSQMTSQMTPQMTSHGSKDIRQNVETQTDDGEECQEPCEDFCSPEVCAVRKCCDTQNCCITIMPGTHERPKKCCASVVPKKRKQHMEQHIGPAGRTRRRKSGERPDTIFIDFGAPMDNPSTSQSNPSESQDNYIQVQGTNMFVRNTENMSFSVDQQNQNQDFSLPEPFQTLLMEDLPLELTDEPVKEEKKKRYPTSKPFKCEHCGLAFNQRIHLKKHLSKHTGIKPFKCGQCNYSTVERSHLKVHIRIHTGEKPFKCGFCEYATAQNSTLKIHLKRHHSGMTLSCTVCGKHFEQPKQLNQHQREHQVEPSAEST